MGLFATASLATAILWRAWLSAERITHKDSSDGAKPMKIIRRAVNTFSKPAGGNIFFLETLGNRKSSPKRRF